MLEKMIRKPKIIVVGAGGAGSKLVENMSKNNSYDIKYLSFDYNVVNDKLLNNHNITTIDFSKTMRITLEEVKSYCIKYDKLQELEEMLSIMQNGDELFKVYPKDFCCIVQEKNWMKIKLKRNNTIINSFELFRKKLNLHSWK